MIGPLMRLDPVRTLLLVALAVLTVSCGSGSDGTATPAGTPGAAVSPAATASPSATGGSEAAADRVVVLGEEFLLADLLAVGVVPEASSATVPEAGFQGLDEFDTEGIEILSVTEPNLEQLAALSPDRIVTSAYSADQIGEDVLGGLAEVTVLPDGLSAEEQVAEVGPALGRVQEADELVAELSAAREEARGAVGTAGCTVSLATVYPGPSVAAWVDGPSEVPATLLDAGCTLVPGTEAATDGSGRAFLSLEQLDLLAGPELIPLQSDTIEGAADAVAALAQDPLWQQVPAVASGAVTELDRLGYPGAAGQVRLIGDLIAALAP